MEYRIKNPQMLGGVVQLLSVAHTMARFRATAGEGFHRPTYNGAISAFTVMLVGSVDNGQLICCDQFGAEMAPAEILKSAKSKNLMVESPDDKDATFAMNVWVSLARLNQWGMAGGNTFTIEDAPWIDERGWQGLDGKPPEELAIDSGEVPADTNTTEQHPPLDYSLLATRSELIDAFGRWGLKLEWFGDLNSRKWLLEARRIKGQGQRAHVVEPLYCPYAVMSGMINKGRKTKRLNPDTAWRMLEHKFPKVYAVFEARDSRELPGD